MSCTYYNVWYMCGHFGLKHVQAIILCVFLHPPTREKKFGKGNQVFPFFPSHPKAGPPAFTVAPASSIGTVTAATFFRSEGGGR